MYIYIKGWTTYRLSYALHHDDAKIKIPPPPPPPPIPPAVCVISRILTKSIVFQKHFWTSLGDIVDLYCVLLSNAASFWENYAKLYFDSKHLEKGLNKGGRVWGEFFGALFSKKVPFLAKMELCPKFPEYA